MADYYDLLGLPKSANDADVRRAYKKAALRWHPDKNPGDRAHAEMMFKRVAEAYRVLSDPRKRAEHDRAPAAQPPSGGQRPAANQQRAPAAKKDPTAVSSKASAKAEEMDEAWSLFEQFFGGRDPFQDFDAFFEDPASADFDRVFANLGKVGARAHGAAATSQSSRPQPSRAVPSAVPAQRATQVRCVARHGVAWRRSMNLADRLAHTRGPEYGDVIAVDSRQGDWVHARDGWLPLTIDGGQVFEILDGSQALSVRCLAPHGVAYRRTMDMNDRMEGIRGPNHGDLVPIEELRGSWVRTAWGWLPMAIGGGQVLELCQEAAPAHGGPPEAGEEEEEEPAGKGEAFWGGWSLLPSGLPVRLLTVMGASGYVALKVARTLLRGWFNMWFGFLPVLWR